MRLFVITSDLYIFRVNHNSNNNILQKEVDVQSVIFDAINTRVNIEREIT